MTKHPFRLTFFLLVCFIFPLTVTAQVVSIPDSNLRAAIEGSLGKASGATITAADMAKLTQLEAENANISNLTGLEFATHLTSLNLGGNSYVEGRGVINSNNISNISALSVLTSLEYLDLGGANITDISALANLTNLIRLMLWDNSITDVSALANLTNLTTLTLLDNSITDISPLAGLTNLIELGLSNNSITDISPVADLTNLGWLFLDNNNISDISALAGLTNLIKLSLNDNSISDVSPLLGLNLTKTQYYSTEVYLEGNPLSYASINMHIPILQNKGITVEFDNQAHPALLKISGDNQKGTSGAALSDPFVIEVQDANGATLTGVSVTFTVISGGGTLNATNTTTDANGRAESTLTLGPNLGKNTVEVSATGIESSLTFYALSDLLPLDVQGKQIYWLANSYQIAGSGAWIQGKIQYANLDGTNVQDLITGLDSEDIALDVAGDKIYWTDFRQGKIQCANLDGTNVQDLITDLRHPSSITLDVPGGKIYYTVTGKIQCANLDGTNVQDLITGFLSAPWGIALDVADGKMYWLDFNTGKIQRANLDGTNVQDTVTGLDSLHDIALDVTDGKIYWTDFNTGKIQRANLDGTNAQDLVTGSQFPLAIALDVKDGKMYWVAMGMGKIQCANLDGTNVQDLVTGLESPVGVIALAIPPDLPPTRADVNQDGKVNIIDLILVVSTLGDTTPTLLLGDVNEDNRVTVEDVLLVIEALDDPVTAAAPSNHGRILPLEGATLEGHLNRLRSHSDGSLKYQRAIAFFQNLLASVAPPDRTELLANYPNPFNPETWIPYRLAEDAFVTLTIYDLSGRVVRTLKVGHRIAAVYESRSKAIYWDGRNALGEQVASGVYFYHLSAGDYSATRRMVILK